MKPCKTLSDFWKKTSDVKFNSLVNAVLEKKYYNEDPRFPNKKKWKVLASKKADKYVILLCEDIKYPGEYCVFTDLIMPNSIPSDKFYGKLSYAINAYVETIERENEKTKT